MDCHCLSVRLQRRRFFQGQTRRSRVMIAHFTAEQWQQCRAIDSNLLWPPRVPATPRDADLSLFKGRSMIVESCFHHKGGQPSKSIHASWKSIVIPMINKYLRSCRREWNRRWDRKKSGVRPVRPCWGWSDENEEEDILTVASVGRGIIFYWLQINYNSAAGTIIEPSLGCRSLSGQSTGTISYSLAHFTRKRNGEGNPKSYFSTRSESINVLFVSKTLRPFLPYAKKLLWPAKNGWQKEKREDGILT